MPNTNCLEGLRCPGCNNESEFRIQITTVVKVTDEGTEDVGAHVDWDDASRCLCPKCEMEGKVADFRILPADVDGQNSERAAWAKAALLTFMDQTGVEFEDSLADLLGDLMHLSDREPFDFDAALNRARDHYAAETGKLPY